MRSVAHERAPASRGRSIRGSGTRARARTRSTSSRPRRAGYAGAAASPSSTPRKMSSSARRGLERDAHERLERGFGPARARDLLVGEQRPASRAPRPPPRRPTTTGTAAIAPIRRPRRSAAGSQPELGRRPSPAARARPTSAPAAPMLVASRARRPTWRCDTTLYSATAPTAASSTTNRARAGRSLHRFTRPEAERGDALRGAMPARSPRTPRVRRSGRAGSAARRDRARRRAPPASRRWSTVAARLFSTAPCAFIHWLCTALARLEPARRCSRAGRASPRGRAPR